VTTAADLVSIAKNRYLVGGGNELRNQLAADFTAGGTTLAFKYDLKGIQAGATLSIGLDVFYVWSADTSNKTAVVSGGQRGATAANHTTGDDVWVTPRYTDFAIFTALNEELSSMDSPGFFAVKQLEIPYSAAKVGYDLTGLTVSQVTDILEVRYDDNQPFARTPRLSRNDWRLERNYLVGEDASTMSLKVFRGGFPGRNLTVLYKTGFSPFTALTDNTTITGLPLSAYDLPPMGAAIRLGVGREIRRNDITSQGDTRRAEEVGPGAVAASWRGLQALYTQRMQSEIQRLQQAYPVVMP
jgi:hypothetical protein